LRFQKL
jgi:hypothetical protein